jgi:hypothetical protein
VALIGRDTHFQVQLDSHFQLQSHVLSDALLFGALILIGLKFGLRTRLKEIGRVLDRLVNVLLALILAAYAVQLGFLFFFGRG